MSLQRASEIHYIHTAKSSPNECHVDGLRNPGPASAIHLTTAVSEESLAGDHYRLRKAG